MLLIEAIKNAQNIILSTHKSADGDGLGSEIAMYHALKKIGKAVSFVHVDIIPSRYHFLLESVSSKDFQKLEELDFKSVDLALIFDTHDPLLCSPLYESLVKAHVQNFFVDHHIKTKSVVPNNDLFIDETASCTGEIVYDLIRRMNIGLDLNISTALYASLIFDTQNFKVIRDSVKPFSMASQLLLNGIEPQKIQDQLFANWNIEKMNYLGYLIQHVSYHENNSVAFIRILKKDLNQYNLNAEHVSDLIDFFMQIKTLTLAVVIREENMNFYKLSFRSRNSALALKWACAFQGGGHFNSAGAWVEKSLSAIESELDSLLATEDFKKTGST